MAEGYAAGKFKSIRRASVTMRAIVGGPRMNNKRIRNPASSGVVNLNPGFPRIHLC